MTHAVEVQVTPDQGPEPLARVLVQLQARVPTAIVGGNPLLDGRIVPRQLPLIGLLQGGSVRFDAPVGLQLHLQGTVLRGT